MTHHYTKCDCALKNGTKVYSLMHWIKDGFSETVKIDSFLPSSGKNYEYFASEVIIYA